MNIEHFLDGHNVHSNRRIIRWCSACLILGLFAGWVLFMLARFYIEPNEVHAAKENLELTRKRIAEEAMKR